LVAKVAQLVELGELPAVDELGGEGVVDDGFVGAGGVGEPVAVEGRQRRHGQTGGFMQRGDGR
jgi:hypothetical protein